MLKLFAAGFQQLKLRIFKLKLGRWTFKALFALVKLNSFVIKKIWSNIKLNWFWSKNGARTGCHVNNSGETWILCPEMMEVSVGFQCTPSLKQLIPGSEGPFLETYFFGHFSLRLSGNNCSRVISMGNFGPTASNLRYEIFTIFGWRLEPSCDHTLGAGLD